VSGLPPGRDDDLQAGGQAHLVSRLERGRALGERLRESGVPWTCVSLCETSCRHVDASQLSSTRHVPQGKPAGTAHSVRQVMQSLLNPVWEGAGDCGGAAGDLEPGVDVFQVGAHGSLRDAEAAGDLGVGVPGGN